MSNNLEIFRGRALFAPPTWQSLGQSLHLSPRELQIVQCVFDDEQEAEIAAKLSISRHTVHTHLERIYRKLDVTSRVQLVTRVFSEFRVITT